MKKLLALVLALVMTLSLATVGSNAFTDDAKFNEKYAEAGEVLTGMGILKGYTDGSFNPTGDITRAEAAAVIYRVYTADVKDASIKNYAGYSKFVDLAGYDWAKGYIGYCENAGFIKGYGDGKFGPGDKVTGYQVLAMILRAMGYGVNGEFTGADWQVNVAKTAQQLGILKNVGAENLSAPAQRQLVAELVFQAIQQPTVTYTPAFGYVAVTGVGSTMSLGKKNFDLTPVTLYEDDWGRPYYGWTYTTGDEATLWLYDHVSYTTAVDECDLAKDLGISSTKAIEKAFIDGEEYNAADEAVTSNKMPTINPLAHTSKLGAQGRLTEVYDMGGKYRIVEINTYLAQVTGVTASKIDKNGHVVDASITLTVYKDGTNATGLTYETTGYAVNDYVLVSAFAANKGAALLEVATVEAVAPVAGGTQNGWTGALVNGFGTTTIGATTYNDADKFVLNAVKGTKAGNWDVITDTYGNLIGLVESAKSYLTIEAARWIDVDHTLYGGYVLANVVLADGTRIENVKISAVNNKAVTNKDITPTFANGEFSDVTTVNDGAADHLYAYSVAADGSYVIDTSVAGSDLTDDKATISNKGTYILDTHTSRVVPVNDNTVFLVADYVGGALTTTYTKYVGKDNVPSLTEASVCYLMNGAYASTVLVTEYKLAANTFVAYVQDVASTTYVVNKGYAFNVYKVGETTPTTVYYAAADLNASGDFDGLYEFTVDANSVASSVVAKAYSTNTFADLNTVETGKLWGKDAVTALNGLTLVANEKYWMNNAEYITLTYTTVGSTKILTVAPATIADIAVGDQVLVRFTGAGELQFAEYVYIFKNASSDIGSGPVTPDTLSLSSASNVVTATLTLGTPAGGTTVQLQYRPYGSGYAWTSFTGAAGMTWTSGTVNPYLYTTTVTGLTGNYEFRAVAYNAAGAEIAVSSNVAYLYF